MSSRTSSTRRSTSAWLSHRPKLPSCSPATCSRGSTTIAPLPKRPATMVVTSIGPCGCSAISTGRELWVRPRSSWCLLRRRRGNPASSARACTPWQARTLPITAFNPRRKQSRACPSSPSHRSQARQRHRPCSRAHPRLSPCRELRPYSIAGTASASRRCPPTSGAQQRVEPSAPYWGTCAQVITAGTGTRSTHPSPQHPTLMARLSLTALAAKERAKERGKGKGRGKGRDMAVAPGDG
mmetsp:Transcript_25056/g.78091  ORF Transcript_25056/g.78091 Transcript_25056/m.78091 type:complete len:239 (+) Transcript_25056:625-1341(+)